MLPLIQSSVRTR